MADENKIKAMIVLDVIGRPPEHIVESLENVAKEIEKEKGVKIISKNIKEPAPMKNNEEFYTTFAEIEIESENFMYMVMIMFKYMPAHIEIIYPEIIAISNTSWNEILNELVRRLHAYDEIARVIQMDKARLEQKIQELTGGVLQASPVPKNNNKTPKTKKSKVKKNTKKKSKK